MQTEYIPRRLHWGDRIITEEVLLREAKVIVVLAEPGAGKSDLLTSFAEQLGTENIRASIFLHRSTIDECSSLVIDAIDEVAQNDKLSVEKIIVRAADAKPNLVVFSSRSNEWGKAETQFVKDCFKSDPAVILLQPCDETEQKVIFEDYLRGEDYSDFQTECDRFDLCPLLGNPQFLKLFADAYVESSRHFTSKRQIYVDAVKRLTSERDGSPKQSNRPPTEAITQVGDEIFAKLLLAGASGVSLIEENDQADFPYLNSLSSADVKTLQYVLDTRLFKPSTKPFKHEPVHRVVQEYCAARYLVRRLNAPSHDFSIARCFALIAPNGVVRKELRGMFGWMAALAGQALQEKCIRMDPYATLAYGDPSILSASSKKLLLKHLESLSEVDPYFRGSDVWRRFSVGEFFSTETVDAVRSLLIERSASNDLRNLLLELLRGSKAAEGLAADLQLIVVDPHHTKHTRILAQRVLTATEGFKRKSNVVELATLGDNESLLIAVQSIAEIGVSAIAESGINSLLLRVASAQNNFSEDGGRMIDESTHQLLYFTSQFISGLSKYLVTQILDELSKELTCSCEAKFPFECQCLVGISKVIGLLLDRYFEFAGSHDAEQIWKWVSKLVFKSYPPEKSASVKALAEDDALRQAIHRLALADFTDREKLSEARMQFLVSQRHAGLHFKSSDYIAITSHAVASNNPLLWVEFYERHNTHRRPGGPNLTRQHMRQQARGAAAYMRLWARLEREARKYVIGEASFMKRDRKWKRRERKRAINLKDFIAESRAKIEAGRHWGFLKKYSSVYLYFPDRLGANHVDISLVETALQCCIPFLSEHAPSLGALSTKQYAITEIFYAACLAHFRKYGNLAGIEDKILRAVKTEVGRLQGQTNVEAEALESEIDNRLFKTTADVENFAREFIEPQLKLSRDARTSSDWLGCKKAFIPLQGKLALNWLERFPEMPVSARDSLFEIAARHGDRPRLIRLIVDRIAACIKPDASCDVDDRAVWFLRALYFLEDPPHEVWSYLRTDQQSIFALSYRSSRMFRGDWAAWPVLTAKKVYQILDVYIARWQKVELPSSYSNSEAPERQAYRFLSEVIYLIGRDIPANSIPVLDQLLADSRFQDFEEDFLGMKAAALRSLAHIDLKLPATGELVKMLDRQQVGTVEDLRALLLDELGELQQWMRHSETDPLDMFYPGGQRLDENSSRNRIVDRLQLRMSSLNLAVTIEQHMADSNRCDITVTAMIEGSRRLLVIEVKGQWHPELFTAASVQLNERYSTHPDAASQGIYLVLWFGKDEAIAGRKAASIETPSELHDAILRQMPNELRGRIDVVVLDLSPK